MKYLCLIYEDESRFTEMPATRWAALRQAVLDYVETLRAEGRLIDTQPLQSATTAKTIRVHDRRRFVTDGPFAETKEQIGGYFIIEAESLDEALDVAARWPSAPLGTIEVRPLEDGLRTDTRYPRHEG